MMRGAASCVHAGQPWSVVTLCPPPPRPTASLRDKRVVRDPESEADIWWGAGSPNYEMDER